MSLVIGPPQTPSSSSKVVKSVALVGSVNTALPVGREALKRLGGKEKEVKTDTGSSSSFPEEKIVIPTGITPQNLGKYTLYDILGFAGELGDSADTEVIKKAYHKAVLMYHPDKAQYKTADGKEDRSVFLKIQQAFTVLCSEPKRRAYDSQLPFDESIPTEEKIQKGLEKGPHKFFKIFAPVFARNARFAAKKPVPELGDMNTPIVQAYKFYDYWVKFESWRDFTGVGAEHKPDDAGSREEKRWMQKENDRIAKKLKKKEMERLITLVSLAEKYDPRIVSDKEARRLAKEAEKNAKENNIQRRIDEEAAAKAWAAALEVAENERRGASTKAEKEKLKKQQSRCRNVLRKLLRFSAELGHGSGEYGIVSSSEVESICTHCGMEDLVEMNTAMGGDEASKDKSLVKADGFAVVTTKLAWVQEKIVEAAEDEAIAKEAKKLEKTATDRMPRIPKAGRNSSAAAALPEEREWTPEQLEVLSKCLTRYGPGLPNRWENIVNFLNVRLFPSTFFTQDDCILAGYKLSIA